MVACAIQNLGLHSCWMPGSVCVVTGTWGIGEFRTILKERSGSFGQNGKRGKIQLELFSDQYGPVANLFTLEFCPEGLSSNQHGVSFQRDFWMIQIILMLGLVFCFCFCIGCIWFVVGTRLDCIGNVRGALRCPMLSYDKRLYNYL